MDFRLTMILAALLMLCSFLGAITNDFECTSNDEFETRLVFRTPTWEMTTVDGMQKIKLPDSYPQDWAGVPGTPELPVFSTLVNIPAGVRVELSYRILDEETIENTTLVPHRDLNDIRDNILTYTIDPEAYYTQSRNLPESVELGDAGIMRSAVLQRVITHPFRYDAEEQQLYAASEIEIELIYHQDSRGLTPKRPTAESPLFRSLTNGMTVNPVTASDRSEETPGVYLFLYDGSEEILTTAEPLIQWKHAKGHEIHIFDTSTVGNNANQIHQYIVNAYQTWENPPEFICFLGDGNMNYSIPTFWENYSSHSVHGDHPYTRLDGDDLFPEAMVGRLAFNTITELQIIVSKILTYEVYPPTDDNWFERILLVGDYYSSGISTNTTMIYIGELMHDYNPAYDFTFINEDPFVMQISNALNQGMGAYFYRGFGNFSNWVNEDSFNLFNYNMTPFMSAITCYTGTFAQGTMSVIESFLRAGTPSNPTGASAVIGSSSPTHTCFNNIITATIAYGIYHEGITNLSAALNLGKLALYESYPTNPNDYVDWYTLGKNLLGDPGMSLWTREPEAFTVNQPLSIEIGATSYAVTITDSQDNPVEGAVVTLIQEGEGIDSRAFTDASGVAILYFEPAETGTTQLVVTKHNYLPSISNPEVIEGNIVDYTDIEYTSAAVTGGTAQFNVTLHNYGSSSLSNVTATISCADTQLDITTSTANYGTIAAGQDATGDTDFTIEISPLCLDGIEFDLMLDISSNSGNRTTHIPLEVSGPMLEVMAVTTTPVAVPGGTVDMYLTLSNIGAETFEAVTCEIATVSQLITISDNAGTIGDIVSGDTADNQASPFTLSIGNDAITGSIIPFTLIATNIDGITQNLEFDLHIGQPSVMDPTGPDGYGYLCYDDGDTAYDDCPTYDWIEIDPNYGGSGTSLAMTDNDYNGWGAMLTIDMPFIFRFYEINYNQISISSNGYIVLGSYYTFEWMNWPIPGPFVPSPIIAPFWDDLIIDEGNVYFWYNEAEHYFVVEWSRLQNRYDGSPETFQAILYDPAYHNTLLGDSKIKFQYMEVNNVDLGNYNSDEIDHGEYATVGIADHTTYYGLEYTYSDIYPVTAKPLEDEMALLFTGPNVPIPYPHPFVSNIEIEDLGGNNNGIIDFGETVEIAMTLSNLGLEIATDISSAITANDPYVTIQQNTINFPDLANGQSADGDQPFSLDIATDCPNGHQVNLVLTIFYSGTSKELMIPFVVYSPELEIVDFNISDDNDDQIESGETGTFTFYLEKASYLNIEDATITLETDEPGFTITPPSYTFDEISDETISVAYEIAFDDTTYNGEMVRFNLHAQYNDSFDVDLPVDYVFGHPEVIMSDSFDGYINYEHWLSVQGTYSETNYAGGEVGEMLLQSVSYDARVAVPSEFLYQDLQKLIIKFRYRNMDGNAQYGILIQQNSTPFTSSFIWTSNEEMDESRAAHIEYIPDISFTGNVIIVFFIYPTEQGVTQTLALDNIEVSAIRHNPGWLQGNITLSGGTASPEDVFLTLDGINYPVGADGSYIVSVPEGIYTVEASLTGYIPFYSQNVVVTHDEATQLDMELAYLMAPSNLACEQIGDQVHLTWDFYENRSRVAKGQKATSDRNLDYFDVIMIFNNNFVIHHDTDDTEYTLDLIAAGHYEFYVKARHLGGYWSEESNHIEMDYVAIDGEAVDAPEVFALYQNHPNPFNPTTSIRFDLPQATSKCLLAIYNVRGEKVTTLVNEPRDAGRYTETWNGRNKHGEQVASGVYFIRIETDTDRSIRKAVMLK